MINEEIITAIDIGTSKIFGISCLLKETGLEVIATHLMNFSDDIVKKGRVADIEEVSNCLYDVLKALKNQAGEPIININIGIGGGHLNGVLYPRSIEIEPKGREISESDINTLKKDVQGSILAAHGTDRHVLYTIPQNYIIDKVNTTSKSPVGMHGNVLQMNVHVITCEVNPVLDIKNCVKKAGAQVEGIYPHSWAVAEATLSEEEKKLGCLLVDMGKGTTDILLYGNGSMVMTDSIKLGGESVDTDISKVLHTPVNYAEEMKKKHARADYNIMIQEKQQSAPENIDVFDLSGKISSTVTSEKLSQIVYARIFQIFGDYIKKSVEKASILQGRTYAIILSGGQARQNGINELVQSIFNIPVRTGLPRGLLNLDKAYQFPEFTSAIGTVLLASRNERKKTKQGIGKKIEDLWGKIKRNF